MPQRPHVILIMTDQHRVDTLGAYGDIQTHTPHLDALAEDSVIFDRHYTPCPLCVPARSALATGLYPHHSGAMINTWIPEERQYGTLKPQHTTVFEHLVAAGYDLAHIGVQHITAEPTIQQRCPNATFIGQTQYDQYLLDHGLEPTELLDYKAPCPEFAGGKMISKSYTSARTGTHPHPVEHFYDTFIADQTAKAIESADLSKPLALTSWFWAPHPPLAAPPPFDTLYGPDQIELPANVGVRYDGQPACQLTNLPGFMGATVDTDGWRRAWAAYLGLVTMVDQCVGKVIDALRKRGIWDDALVIFTADHGEMLGAHRMFQKMCMYDESIRVPMFVKPPGGMPSGQPAHRTQLTSHVDIASTVYDYARIDADPGDGQSMRPAIESATVPSRHAVFVEFNGNAGRSSYQRAIVTDTHKYIHNQGDHAELYDRVSDPLETTNLANSEQHAATADALLALMMQWMSDTGDFLELE